MPALGDAGKALSQNTLCESVSANTSQERAGARGKVRVQAA